MHACHANLTCYDLSALLENGSNWYMNAVIGFLEGNYSLSKQWIIANVSNLTLLTLVDHENEEKSSQGAVFECGEGAGLIVISSDQVNISGLTFVGCGTAYVQSPIPGYSGVSSLWIIETSDVALYACNTRTQWYNDWYGVGKFR